MANKLMRKFHIPLPHTIYNDIDTNKYYPIPKRKTYRSSLEISEGSFLVGYAGDLEPRKNVDTLIKAFSKPKIHKKWLVIAGRGKEKGRLMRMVEELSILSITTFVDWTDEVNKLLNCIDLLVLPSEYEGCPNIILEAMGAEISFLASDVRGTREIVPKSQRFTYRDDVELAKLIMLQHKTEIDFKSQVNNKKFIFNWEERVLNCCF